MAGNPVDVLLIGSGASGGPFAWYLSRTPGVTVMCLEQGDWDRESVIQETQEQWQRLVKPRPQAAGRQLLHQRVSLRAHRILLGAGVRKRRWRWHCPLLSRLR